MSLIIKRPEKLVPLCLDASLQVEWERAEAALVQARKAPASDRLTGNAEVTRLAAEVQAIEGQMLEQVVHFRLRGLPRSTWAKVLAENPATDDPEHKAFGGNKEAFFEAVLMYVDKDRPRDVRTIVDVKRGDEPVEFDPAKDWASLADEMTDRQYADFADAVFTLNRGSVSVPFSRAASTTSRASSETSQ
ncbi:hypothetical protein QUV83_08235 [Cellulomonas cellasea]|uniref:hypothetical protein n=1 Tax=Cellulomonas cellasea TaxID=43670 RepID=UPI0025A3B3EA|nr:hypothetical protein [Cellulomonas cellasea]MDM8084748.1 hypothetical protein [Cellulomonas cellasea]